MPNWSALDVSALAQQFAQLVPLRGTVPQTITTLVMVAMLALMLWLLGRNLRVRGKSAVQISVRLVLLVIAAVMISSVCWFYVNDVWRPLPDYIGLEVFGPVAVGLISIFALIGILFSKSLKRIVTAVIVCVLALVASYTSPNIYYGTYATLADVFQGTGDVEDFDAIEGAAPVSDLFVPKNMATPSATSQQSPASPKSSEIQQSPASPKSFEIQQSSEIHQSLQSQWKPRGEVGAEGVLASADIPVTDFSPRTSYIYLPPAYFAHPRPLLPVLVLMAGQPGSPEDWVSIGHLKRRMDDFAAQHHGLSPIVVSVDQLLVEF